MLTVAIDIREIDGAIEAMETRSRLFGQAAIRGTEATALMHTRHTINTKLTEANPPFLNQRTGALAYSVSESIKQERATLVGDRVRAVYGTDKDYGYKHEVGGTYKEQVRAHTRRVKSRNVRSGRALNATGVAFVKAHTRNRTYRARRMFATALAQLSAEATIPIARAMETLLKDGRIADIRSLLAGTLGANPARIRRQ